MQQPMQLVNDQLPIHIVSILLQYLKTLILLLFIRVLTTPPRSLLYIVIVYYCLSSRRLLVKLKVGLVIVIVFIFMDRIGWAFFMSASWSWGWGLLISLELLFLYENILRAVAVNKDHNISIRIDNSSTLHHGFGTQTIILANLIEIARHLLQIIFKEVDTAVILLLHSVYYTSITSFHHVYC